MYIDSIEIENFRCFQRTRIAFCHADKDFAVAKLPKPRLPNMNLLLADNGFGKSTLLRAIALTALGPAVANLEIEPRNFIREGSNSERIAKAVLRARFTAHEQDASPVSRIASHIEIREDRGAERLVWAHRDAKRWHPALNQQSHAFFVAGYGSTRRVNKEDSTTQPSGTSPRLLRVLGLFQEDYLLQPLSNWIFSTERDENVSQRHNELLLLLKALVGSAGWQLAGKHAAKGEYYFSKGDLVLPFAALSDGHRAFLGWVCDLLYHICKTCPANQKLSDNKGIVMVDEIDLHLHPKWQMTVLATLAKALPNIQFIVTSHSPLVVGSLEWMNVIVMRCRPKQACAATRIQWPIHGLDADQILLTEFFGLDSTRAHSRARKLKELSLEARDGNSDAALELLKLMSRGEEGAG